MSDNEKTTFPEDVIKVYDAMNKHIESIESLLEQQKELEKVTKPLASWFESYKSSVLFSSPALEAIDRDANSAEFLSTKFRVPATVLESIRLLNEPISSKLTELIMRNVLSTQPAISGWGSSPALDWFRSFDITPITKALDNIHIDSILFTELYDRCL